MAFIEFKKVSKRFPGVIALDAVSVTVDRGSCHALMGENGAGKSTLGRILCGVYTADGGEIWLEGQPIRLVNPLAARKHGIAMVHQELAFCPNLTVAENLCLGDLPSGLAGWVDRAKMRDRAREMLGEIEAAIDVDCPTERLSTGQEQMVQIAAAVGTGARTIVFDEPTSSLSVAESGHLFALIEKLRRRGITIIYISHRLEEIFRLCDRVTVLRDGRHIVTENASETNQDRLIEQMVGRRLGATTATGPKQTEGEEVLRVEGLSSPERVRDVSFSLRAGEILGFAGLIGSGRSEVARAIFGLDAAATGRVIVGGKELRPGDVGAALAAGLGLVPEDRKRQGLILSMNCRQNVSLASLERLTKFGFVKLKTETTLAGYYLERLRVRTPTQETLLASLSGGNQQKIGLAKWLARECRILIVDEPTRGVDVGAKAEIHTLLRDLAGRGVALVVISSELPEVMSLSSRMIVMREGEIVGELARREFSEEKVIRLMAGVERRAA